MGKKVKKRVPKVKALTGEEYWTMRAAASEMERIDNVRKLMKSQAENSRLRAQMAEDRCEFYQKQLEEATEEYYTVVKSIEERIGQSLENCNIDSKEYTVHKGV